VPHPCSIQVANILLLYISLSNLLLFYPLDSKHWATILHLKLNHDANRLEHSLLVFLKNSFDAGISMIKNLEVLELGIEGFMSGFCPVLEFPDGWGAKWVANTDLFWLALVAFIPDYLLVGRDLAFQAIRLAINGNIILPCRKGAIDPNKCIATDGDP
jgi:hypothetical protein